MDPISEQNQQQMLRRLARVEGQLRGVQKMIRDGSDCEKVAQQLTAARRALDKAFHEMLACMIEYDVIGDTNSKNARDQMSQIRSLLSKYA